MRYFFGMKEGSMRDNFLAHKGVCQYCKGREAQKVSGTSQMRCLNTFCNAVYTPDLSDEAFERFKEFVMKEE